MEEKRPYEVATFAVGCFWDAEAAFRQEEGVIATRVGYTGGSLADPTYEQFAEGGTGHLEAVQVIFDPTRTSYERLLDRFFRLPDPSSLPGERTRSAIFYHSDEQKAAAEASRERSRERRDLKVEILPAGEFWMADESHQQYYEKCGQGYCTSEQYWE